MNARSKVTTERLGEPDADAIKPMPTCCDPTPTSESSILGYTLRMGIRVSDKLSELEPRGA